MSGNSRRSDQHYQHHYNYPSFSSSLLEEIYRSFDEDSERDRDHSSHYSDTTSNTSSSYKKSRYNNSNSNSNKNSSFMDREKSDDKYRVNRFVLDQWMKENTINNHNNNFRRNSMTTTAAVNSVAKSNSSSSTSSSDSSSGICGFSSSDTDSLYGSSKSKSKPKNMTLKPIKTTVNQPESHRKSEIPTNNSKKNSINNNHKEGNLQKRALKLYGDLKKVKQPISPGGKLATFLNSLFNSNASKKPKISTSSTTSSSSSSNAVKCSSMSTPSTASSYSRSCLSKTPSSAGRFERRSVRFCPVNTVMAYSNNEEREDELMREKASRNDNDELKVQIMEKHRRVEEVAKELLKNYQYHGRKYQTNVNHLNNNKKKSNIISSFEDEDEEEEDDDASCCSADLFELEIGGNHQRYCEELPVYETTHVHTNRAIAKGFIL